MQQDRSNVCGEKNTRTSTFTKKRGMSTKSSPKKASMTNGGGAEKHCHAYLVSKPSAGPAPGTDTLASGDKITGPARHEQPWLPINQRQERKQQPRPSAQKRGKGPGLQMCLSSLLSPHVWAIAVQPGKASEMTHAAVCDTEHDVTRPSVSSENAEPTISEMGNTHPDADRKFC